MLIDVIFESETFAPLKENWEAVYDADPNAQFFLSWAWVSRWLDGTKRQWFILATKPDTSGSYVAFFPLRYRGKKTKDGAIIKEIAMACNRAADYTGFLCMPGFEERAAAEFAKVIKKLDWQSLHLENICTWSQNNDLFLRQFSENEFVQHNLKPPISADKIDNNVCPYVELPDNWQTYLQSSLNSNMRRKVRRYMETIDNSGDFHITISNEHTIHRDMNILLRFWETKWSARKGGRLDSIINVYRVMIWKCFSARSLFMPILWHGDKPIGALACFTDEKNRSLLMYVAGRDESIQKPPPGLLLNAFCIKQAIENGYKTYDFLRGNEPYKYLFGAKERSISYIRIEPKNAGRM